MKWALFYDSAVHDDDPRYPYEKIGLTKEFLDSAQRTMGPYMFANNYLNETIPEHLQIFQRSWIHKYAELPRGVVNYAFIDPAIGQENDNDYTAIVVVGVDPQGNWYVQLAKRDRLTPTQIVEACFALQAEYNCASIGIEDVAYQKALLYLVDEEMTRRDKMIPLFGIKPGNDETKAMRIKALVPRYYWARVFHKQGLDDLEKEMMQFPRGKHDDIIDALAYIDKMASTPTEDTHDEEAPPPNSPKYEAWFIKQRFAKSTKR